MGGSPPEREEVETVVGTMVLRTPRYLRNPVTNKRVDMTSLSTDGYCRRFLATLVSASNQNTINFSKTPVATFSKDKWELRETDGSYVVVKRDAESEYGERVLAEDEDD